MPCMKGDIPSPRLASPLYVPEAVACGLFASVPRCPCGCLSVSCVVFWGDRHYVEYSSSSRGQGARWRWSRRAPPPLVRLYILYVRALAHTAPRRREPKAQNSFVSEQGVARRVSLSVDETQTASVFILYGFSAYGFSGVWRRTDVLQRQIDDTVRTLETHDDTRHTRPRPQGGAGGGSRGPSGVRVLTVLWRF